MLKALWNYVTSPFQAAETNVEEPKSVEKTKRHHTRHRRRYNEPGVSSSSEEDEEQPEVTKLRGTTERLTPIAAVLDENENRYDKK